MMQNFFQLSSSTKILKKEFQYCDFYSAAFTFCFLGQRGHFPKVRPFWTWVKIGQRGVRDGKLPPSQAKLAHTKAQKVFPKIWIPLAFYRCSSNAVAVVVPCGCVWREVSQPRVTSKDVEHSPSLAVSARPHASLGIRSGL